MNVCKRVAVQLHTFLSFTLEGCGDQLYFLSAWMYQCKTRLLFVLGALWSQCRCSVAQKSNICTQMGDKPTCKMRNPSPAPTIFNFQENTYAKCV